MLVKQMEVLKHNSSCSNEVIKGLFHDKHKTKVKVQKSVNKHDVVPCDMSQTKLQSQSCESESESKVVSEVEMSIVEFQKSSMSNCGKL